MSGKTGALPRPADMGGSEFLRELSRAPLSSDFTHLRQPTTACSISFLGVNSTCNSGIDWYRLKASAITIQLRAEPPFCDEMHHVDKHKNQGAATASSFPKGLANYGVLGT